MNLPSAVESCTFRGRRLYIKRDDLVDRDLSGNKFRKLHFLITAPSNRYRRIISYGGSQSNAMASIAALCKRKGWAFLYITNVLSATLRNNIAGNLKAALDDGMQLLELSHDEYRNAIASLYSPAPEARIQWGEGDLLLAQGGADPGAKEGIERLAREIKAWKREQKVDKLTVVTPSGTGTTAYFLAAFLPDLDVVTTPLIGTETYLREQMAHLGALPKNLHLIEPEKRYRFATPYPEYLDVYKELLKEGVEIDLLYAPKMYIALSAVLEEIEGEILYIHSGGVRGNSSMIERYRYKGML